MRTFVSFFCLRPVSRIAVGFLALTALVACRKQAEQEAGTPGLAPDEKPVIHYDSDFTVQADEATKLSFDALDGYALKWSDNDRILISNGPAYKSYFVEAGGDARAEL